MTTPWIFDVTSPIPYTAPISAAKCAWIQCLDIFSIEWSPTMEWTFRSCCEMT